MGPSLFSFSLSLLLRLCLVLYAFIPLDLAFLFGMPLTKVSICFHHPTYYRPRDQKDLEVHGVYVVDKLAGQGALEKQRLHSVALFTR